LIYPHPSELKSYPTPFQKFTYSSGEVNGLRVSQENSAASAREGHTDCLSQSPLFARRLFKIKRPQTFKLYRAVGERAVNAGHCRGRLSRAGVRQMSGRLMSGQRLS